MVWEKVLTFTVDDDMASPLPTSFEREVIDYKTSKITDHDPLRSLFFY